MKRLLMPAILLLLGVGGGVGAGIILAPAPSDEDGKIMDGAPDANGDEPYAIKATETEPTRETGGPVEYLNMSNQFIIPLVDTGEVEGIVVATISLEVKEGTISGVNRHEPKIRDQFLQVLFNHANNGGFEGNFTDFHYIKSLKEELLRNAQVVVGRDVTDVLILDLVRQDPQ